MIYFKVNIKGDERQWVLESGDSEILVDGEKERFWFLEEIQIRIQCLLDIELINKEGDPYIGNVNQH